MKKNRAFLLTGILITALLSGCGGSGASHKSADNSAYEDDYGYDYDTNDLYATMSEEAAPAEASGNGNGQGIDDSSVENSSRKIIKTVNITAETEEFDLFITNVSAKVESLGGYLERSEISGRSIRDSKAQDRNANLVARIPAKNLDSFISEVSDNSNILNKSESADDVTLSYADTAAHIESLRAEQKRLNELLLQADDIETIIAIEARLTDVSYELESYESRLRTIDNQVDYSTVYINVNEVQKYTVVEEKEETVGERIANGFTSNLSKAGKRLVDFFVTLIVDLPTILVSLFFLALPIAVIFLLWKLFSKKIMNSKIVNQYKAERERRIAAEKARIDASMANAGYLRPQYMNQGAYQNPSEYGTYENQVAGFDEQVNANAFTEDVQSAGMNICSDGVNPADTNEYAEDGDSVDTNEGTKDGK